MSSCCSAFCVAGQRQFTAAVARRDLKLYRRRGPDLTTRLLRDAIVSAGSGSTVLDVGAGIGALSFELLTAGAGRATAVDAAPAYLTAAREEAGRRNLSDRLELVHGDFVTVAGDIAPADVVAMDRVVCCYPAYQPLLEAALQRSRRLFAFSYPRDRWYVRAVVAVQNLGRALFRNPFRTFVHSAGVMEALLERHGFSRMQRRETLVWSADLYVRTGAAHKRLKLTGAAKQGRMPFVRPMSSESRTSLLRASRRSARSLSAVRWAAFCFCVDGESK